MQVASVSMNWRIADDEVVGMDRVEFVADFPGYKSCSFEAEALLDSRISGTLDANHVNTNFHAFLCFSFQKVLLVWMR